MRHIPTGDGTHHTQAPAVGSLRRAGGSPGSGGEPVTARQVARGLVVLALVAAGLALAPTAASAQSTPLVTNAAETSAGGHTVASDELLAVSFTTGAHPSGYWLSSVGLYVTVAGGARPTVAIHDDSSGSPGTSLATLTNPPSFGAGTGEDVFTAPGVELAARTTYWVVIDKGSIGTLAVGQTRSDDQTGEAGWSIGDAWQDKADLGAWTASAEGKTLRLSLRGEERPPLLVRNTAQTPATGTEAVSADELVAVSFTTGANPGGYWLSSVALYMQIGSSAVPVVAIYDDSSGSPGTSQATLINPDSYTVANTRDVFTAAAVTLGANTTYWVVIDKGTAGTLAVGQTGSDGQTGEAGWSIGDAWQNKIGTNAWGDSLSSLTLRLSIFGEAINSDPVFATGSAARSVRENTYLGYLGGVVGPNTFSGNVGAAVAARDPDGDRLTYSVVATSDSDGAAHLAAFNEDFALNARTGQVSVKAGALIDYETRSSYKVTVQVSDNKGLRGAPDTEVDDTVELTVTVTDVANEVPHTTRLLQVSSAGNDCLWTPGEKVVVTVNFNEAVTVDTTGGTPSLTLHLATRKPGVFVYDSGSGTRDLKFVYTVPSSVGSFYYLRAYDSTLVTNGGSITSTATGAAADLRHGAISWAPRSVRCGPWPDTSKARPTITGVEVSGAWEHGPDAGTWGNGRAVDVWLTFSEAVDVFYLDKEAWAYTPAVQRTLTLPTVTIETTFGTETATYGPAGPRPTGCCSATGPAATRASSTRWNCWPTASFATPPGSAPSPAASPP